MRRSFRLVALSIASSILLSGCVTTGTTPGAADRPLTPAEQKLREQADTYNQTILQGALLGCAVGAGAGALATKNKGAGLLGGCLAGALVGGTAASYIADKQEQYATREQQLDSMIADVHGENERLAGLVGTAQQVIADDKAKIEAIDSELAANKITLDQAKTRMAAVDDNRAYLDNTLKELNKRKQTYADAAAKMQTGDKKRNQAMKDEVTQLERQIAQLQTERDALVQRRTISRVG